MKRRSTDLSSDGDLRAVLVPERAPAAIRVVEDDRDGRLGDPGLALLVDELLEVRGANLLQIRDPEHEADGIEDVRLPRSVQTRDGVEEGIESRNHRSSGVGFEPFQADLFDVHGFGEEQNPRIDGRDGRSWRRGRRSDGERSLGFWRAREIGGSYRGFGWGLAPFLDERREM